MPRQPAEELSGPSDTLWAAQEGRRAEGQAGRQACSEVGGEFDTED